MRHVGASANDESQSRIFGHAFRLDNFKDAVRRLIPYVTARNVKRDWRISSGPRELSTLPRKVGRTYNRCRRLPGEGTSIMAPRFEEEENKARAHAGHQAFVDFEELLGDLSSSFVRVSVEEIDSEVGRWLEKIALAMGADRSSVLQMDPGGGGVCVTHQWSRPGVTTPDIRGVKTNVAKLYPWASAKVLSGELLIFSSLDEIPPEAHRDLASARHVSLKSNLLIPVRVGGAVLGALSFGTVFSERVWSRIDVQRLKLVAEIF